MIKNRKSSDREHVIAQLPSFLHAIGMNIPLNRENYNFLQLVVLTSTKTIHILIQDGAHVRTGITGAGSIQFGASNTGSDIDG